jgi:hypothetical protein
LESGRLGEGEGAEEGEECEGFHWVPPVASRPLGWLLVFVAAMALAIALPVALTARTLPGAIVRAVTLAVTCAWAGAVSLWCTTVGAIGVIAGAGTLIGAGALLRDQSHAGGEDEK